jgi:hypothetical protein
MRIVDQAVSDVVFGGLKNKVLEAGNEKEAESLRVMAFRVKAKMSQKYAADVSIQKFRQDGRVFVKIYRNDTSGIKEWTLGENGELIEADPTPPNWLMVELESQRKEGRAEEEISKILADWKRDAKERRKGKEESSVDQMDSPAVVAESPISFFDKEKEKEEETDFEETRAIEKAKEGREFEKAEMRRLAMEEE